MRKKEYKNKMDEESRDRTKEGKETSRAVVDI